MKHTMRILCTVLAAVMLLSMVLTGCDAPKLVIGGTPDVAGTVGGKQISTGEYLAYLYDALEYEYNNGMAMYYMYTGADPWTQQYYYGEGDAKQTVNLSQYITLMAQDTIKRQAVLQKMMADNGIQPTAEEVAELDKQLAEGLSKDNCLKLGFTWEKYAQVYKSINLNEQTLFFGLYGEKGKRAVAKEELQKYYDDNYVCYKMISIPLTDSKGKELDEAGKKKITDRLDGYLKLYGEDKDFEMVMDTYNRDEAAEDKKDEVKTSTDEDNRKFADTKDESMDENLTKAIRSVNIGEAKVVTYKKGGTTPTAALIVRLDPNENDMFEDYKENILYTLKYEEFNKEVSAAAKALAATFDPAVVNTCKPEKFLEQ